GPPRVQVPPAPGPPVVLRAHQRRHRAAARRAARRGGARQAGRRVSTGPRLDVTGDGDGGRRDLSGDRAHAGELELVDRVEPRPVVSREVGFHGRVWDVVSEVVDLGAAGRVTRDYIDHPG